MEAKKGFIFYHDYRQHLELLSDQDKGRLLMALLTYSENGEKAILEGSLQMAFSFICANLHRDQEKYNARCLLNRENGAKGGRPKESERLIENPEKPNGYSMNPIEPKKPDIDIDNKIDINLLCASGRRTAQEINVFFERIWSLYPNKKNKSQISSKKKRELFDIGEETISKCINLYKEELRIDNWKKPKNGSTFFNGGYIDYLDANYSPNAKTKGESVHDKYKRLPE